MPQLPEQKRYQHPHLSGDVTADDLARLEGGIRYSGPGFASDLKIALPKHPMLRRLRPQALLAGALEVNNGLTHKYDTEQHMVKTLEYAAASRLVLADKPL